MSITPNDESNDGNFVWSKYILITSTILSESSAVPEWDDYAIMLILLIVISGFFQIKKN